MNEERREFTRVRVPIAVELRIDGRRVRALLRDVSMRGASVRCGEAIDVGTRCRLVIPLEGGAHIDADARVVRATGGGLALEIDDLRGLDSYRHLRGLVLTNAPDPDAAEREVDAHLGIRRRP